ncbi:ABC transporter permease [Chloroflexi bacterium TSY]|nr:ABC transporter permease [Chloroflexi bacterium TSY]
MLYYGAGDPIRRMFDDMEAGGMEVDQTTIDALRAKYGLDKTLPEQFATYLSNFLRGELGQSIREKRSVTDMVRARFPISLQLGLVSTLLSIVIALPLGVLASLRHNRLLDQIIVSSSVFVNAIPIFVTGPILMLFLVVGLGVMNVPFGWKGIFHTQVILPIFVLALGPLPLLIRQTRSAMLEVMGEDFIRTARSKGLMQRLIISRHMLRPVLIPVVTSAGLVLISVVNGAIFVEIIFGIPGLGHLAKKGIDSIDYSVIMGTVMVGAVIAMAGNLLVDLMYPFLDPRITRD